MRNVDAHTLTGTRAVAGRRSGSTPWQRQHAFLPHGHCGSESVRGCEVAPKARVRRARPASSMRLVGALCASAWLAVVHAMRIQVFLDSGTRNRKYDCLEAGQFVKLSKADEHEYALNLCPPHQLQQQMVATSSQSACWLRCSDADIVLDDVRAFIRKEVEHVEEQLEALLRIKWEQRQIRTWPSLRDPGSPRAFSDEQICPMISRSVREAVTNDFGGRGSDTVIADLFVYVTLRPTPADEPGTTTICLRDGLGRPTVAHVNINAALAKHLYLSAESPTPRPNAPPGDLETRRTETVQSTRNLILHEFLHTLVMTQESVRQFRNLELKLWPEVVKEQGMRGVDSKFLVTPGVLFALRQHYKQAPPTDLDAVVGLEVVQPEAAGQGLAADELHISPQVARSDIMSPAYDHRSVLSTFSLAVLEDSGWYEQGEITTGAEATSERMVWANGVPLDFLYKEPMDNSSAVVPYDCNHTDLRISCSYIPSYKGFCVQPQNAELWGLSSFVQPRPDLGSCQEVSEADSPFFKGSSILEEVQGANSSCFELARPAGGDVFIQEAVCLHKQCDENSNLIVTINGEQVNCAFGQTVEVIVNADNTTEVYKIHCPHQRDACPHQSSDAPCPASCSGNGKCVTNRNGVDPPFVCECDPGWEDADCSLALCRACSSADGSANGEESSSASSADGGDDDDDCMESCQPCQPGVLGATCNLPQPVCTEDCSAQGLRSLCIGNQCELQCSRQGRTCRPVPERVKEQLPKCRAFLDEIEYACLPAGDAVIVAAELAQAFTNEEASLTRSSMGDACKTATEALACHKVVHACLPSSDVELPVCLAECREYVSSCRLDSPEFCSDVQEYRHERCTGRAVPQNQRMWVWLISTTVVVAAVALLAFFFAVGRTQGLVRCLLGRAAGRARSASASPRSGELEQSPTHMWLLGHLCCNTRRAPPASAPSSQAGLLTSALTVVSTRNLDSARNTSTSAIPAAPDAAEAASMAGQRAAVQLANRSPRAVTPASMARPLHTVFSTADEPACVRNSWSTFPHGEHSDHYAHGQATPRASGTTPRASGTSSHEPFTASSGGLTSRASRVSRARSTSTATPRTSQPVCSHPVSPVYDAQRVTSSDFDRPLRVYSADAVPAPDPSTMLSARQQVPTHNAVNPSIAVAGVGIASLSAGRAPNRRMVRKQRATLPCAVPSKDQLATLNTVLSHTAGALTSVSGSACSGGLVHMGSDPGPQGPCTFATSSQHGSVAGSAAAGPAGLHPSRLSHHITMWPAGALPRTASTGPYTAISARRTSDAGTSAFGVDTPTSQTIGTPASDRYVSCDVAAESRGTSVTRGVMEAQSGEVGTSVGLYMGGGQAPLQAQHSGMAAWPIEERPSATDDPFLDDDSEESIAASIAADLPNLGTPADMQQASDNFRSISLKIGSMNRQSGSLEPGSTQLGPTLCSHQRVGSDPFLDSEELSRNVAVGTGPEADGGRAQVPEQNAVQQQQAAPAGWQYEAEQMRFVQGHGVVELSLPMHPTNGDMHFGGEGRRTWHGSVRLPDDGGVQTPHSLEPGSDDSDPFLDE